MQTLLLGWCHQKQKVVNDNDDGFTNNISTDMISNTSIHNDFRKLVEKIEHLDENEKDMMEKAKQCPSLK